MVNFEALSRFNISSLTEFADEWDHVYKGLSEAQGLFGDTVLNPLKNETWQGQAGDAAKAECGRIQLDLDAIKIEVKSLRSYMDEKSSELKAIQDDAISLHYEALGKELSIDAEGKVSWSIARSPGPLSPEQQREQTEKNQAAGEIERKVEIALAAATEIDDEMQGVLKVIFGTTDNFETEARGYHHDSTLTDLDEITRTKLAAARFAMDHHYGYHNASRLLTHYLESNGTPMEVNPDEMMNDMPQFKRDVEATLAQISSTPDGTFSTEWASSAPNPIDDTQRNRDWYFALNHFQYRLVGQEINNEIRYHVEVQKRYDWGIPSEHRSTLNQGPISIEQGDIAYLHTTGKGKDFDVHGTSSEKIAP